MTPESVMMMGTEAMKVAIAVAAPLLLVALVTGLIISILRAATQINEMTLSFIRRSLPSSWRLSLPGHGCSICCWTICATCSPICLTSSADGRCCISPAISLFSGSGSISGRCCASWR